MLQSEFPSTLARLPKLAVLDMKNNKFECAFGIISDIQFAVHVLFSPRTHSRMQARLLRTRTRTQQAAPEPALLT